MQIIDEFCGQSQGSSGQMEVITRNGKSRGLIGGILPHLLLQISNSPSFSSEHNQPSHVLAGSRVSGG